MESLELSLIQENEDIIKNLLKDNNTSHPIIFATNNYENNFYHFSTPILSSYVLNNNEFKIKNRSKKSLKLQTQRTKEYAEVSTPSWVCYQQINGIEASLNNYNDNKNSSMNLNVLEMCCGEAPYITNNDYSSTIPLNVPIGYLDRKLDTINTTNEDKILWFDKVQKAFQSIYGFEYQGDSLFLARLNLLNSFIKYYQLKWNTYPQKSELIAISLIVSWNVWQMDGLSEKTHCGCECMIKNWKDNSVIAFSKILHH